MAISWAPIALAVVSFVILVVIVGLLRFITDWRKPPERSYQPNSASGVSSVSSSPRVSSRQMKESDVPAAELESVEHDEYDPVGTAILLALYFVVVGVVWLFMYFVEFLGNGPTVIG